MRATAAAIGLLLLLPACATGDCWADGPPDSPPLAVGQSSTGEVQVADGLLGAVDVDGGYHPVPRAAQTVTLDDGPYDLPVRRTATTVEVQVADRWVALEERIGCE